MIFYLSKYKKDTVRRGHPRGIWSLSNGVELSQGWINSLSSTAIRLILL